jgi:hypothetical protein
MLENLKILRRQFVDQRSDYLKCSNDIYEVAQSTSCFKEPEITSYKEFELLMFDIMSNDNFVNSIESGISDENRENQQVCDKKIRDKKSHVATDEYMKKMQKKFEEVANSMKATVDLAMKLISDKEICVAINTLKPVLELKDEKECKFPVDFTENILKISETYCKGK